MPVEKQQLFLKKGSVGCPIARFSYIGVEWWQSTLEEPTATLCLLEQQAVRALKAVSKAKPEAPRRWNAKAFAGAADVRIWIPTRNSLVPARQNGLHQEVTMACDHPYQLSWCLCSVVRAVRDVPAGEELTVSYLGREDFSPAAARSRLLEERWVCVWACARKQTRKLCFCIVDRVNCLQ
eukprot:1157914-Pelagomonas_calceolata.AAC.4